MEYLGIITSGIEEETVQDTEIKGNEKEEEIVMTCQREGWD